MRSNDVMESLPHAQLGFEIDFALAAQGLIKFLLVKSVGSLDLSVELRRAAFDECVPASQVFDVPMELRLELMAGLNLLPAIIIYWNTKHLGCAVTARRRAG